SVRVEVFGRALEQGAGGGEVCLEARRDAQRALACGGELGAQPEGTFLRGGELGRARGATRGRVLALGLERHAQPELGFAGGRAGGVDRMLELGDRPACLVEVSA